MSQILNHQNHLLTLIQEIRIFLCLNYFKSLYLLAGLVFSSITFAKSPFPARGFAKVLNDQEAEIRLNSYRSFVVRDLNRTDFHQGYAFRFRLRHMPRRGEEFSRTGTIYGLALGHGISRIDIDSQSDASESVNYLLQSGQEPKAWIYLFDQKKSIPLSDKQLFDPIVSGMNQSPFDLLLSFIFWEFKYLKSGKVAGRPSHIYSFSPPGWVENARSDIANITLALDDNYQAPLRVETFSKKGASCRTYILNSLKKIDGQWVVKSLDCKDRTNRSTTRFEVTAVALNLDFGSRFFSPLGLSDKPVIADDVFISTK